MPESTQDPVAEWTEHNAKRGLDPLGISVTPTQLAGGPSCVAPKLSTRSWPRAGSPPTALLVSIGHSERSTRQGSVSTSRPRLNRTAGRAISNGRHSTPPTARSSSRRVSWLTGLSTTSHCRAVSAKELADAFGAALGAVADQLYDLVQRGWANTNELDQVAAALPSAIPVAGTEATLYGRLLLEADQSRGRTVALLLAVARLLEREPTPDDFRWIMYAGSDSSGRPLALDFGAGGHTGEALASQRDRWWVYQANDLCHVAYEALVKYLLDVLADHPAGMAPRRLVEQCADGINAAMDDGPATWRAWIASNAPAQNARDEDDPASEFALAAQVMGAGRDERRQCGPEHGVAAIRLLATLQRRLEDENHDLDVALGSLADPLFRSLLTERRFLEQRRDGDLRRTLFALLEERVLGRHLWVALRKLRYQNDYTFLVEMDDGLVRLRALDGPVYTTPRIGSALAFLKDCHLVDANGMTQQGLAALSR